MLIISTDHISPSSSTKSSLVQLSAHVSAQMKYPIQPDTCDGNFILFASVAIASFNCPIVFPLVICNGCVIVLLDR